MNFIFILLVSISCASAHIPVFPNVTKISSYTNALEVDEVTVKSYGVYGKLKGDSILYFKMVDTVGGEDLSVSLQTNTKDKTVHYDAVIWGPSFIPNCTSEWYGWTTHGLPDGVDFVRDKSGIPSSLANVIGPLPLIHIHGKNGLETEFEPFGVGVYRPVGACNTTFPDNGDYYIAIFKPPHELMGDIHFSVGIGMKESFFPEIFFFPWTRVLERAGDWSGRYMISYIFQWGGVIDAFIYFFYVFLEKLDNKPHSLSIIAFEAYFIACGTLMIVNALVVSINLITCSGQLDDGFQKTTWLIPVIVQIVFPFALGVTILYTQRRNEEYTSYDVGVENGKLRQRRLRENKWKMVGVLFAAAYFYFFVIYNVHAIIPLFMICGSIFLFFDFLNPENHIYKSLASNIPRADLE